jgi:hypothetical protein
LSDLDVEMVANVLINRKPLAPSASDRSARRWLEIPQEERGRPEAIDLQAEYEAATGVPLADLRLIAVTLWARAVSHGGFRCGPKYLEQLGLGPERTARALALVSGTTDELSSAVSDDAAPDEDYDSSVFGRRPVMRLANGGFLVLSPLLLLERAFGWLPSWDLRNGLASTGAQGRRRADRALTYLRHTTEVHAVETLAHLASTGRLRGVLYAEDAIQDAFGASRPNADCAIEWPGAWVVAEVSSRTVTRETAARRSLESLLDDVSKGVVAKAKQIDGTIAALRRDEARLTHLRSAEVRRFWPVLVTTEGFPVHPLLMPCLRQMITASGLLTHQDTAPLVIMDTEAVEAAEACAERGGPNLPKLLTPHADSGMSSCGFREWLLLTYPGLRPPTRVLERWHRVLEPALAAGDEHDPTDYSSGGRGEDTVKGTLG